MKRKIVQATFLMISLATVFVVVVPAVHAAENMFKCQSSGRVGIHPHGNPHLPTGPVLGAASGRVSVDAAGTSLARRPGMWGAASPTRLSLDRGR